MVCLLLSIVSTSDRSDCEVCSPSYDNLLNPCKISYHLLHQMLINDSKSAGTIRLNPVRMFLEAEALELLDAVLLGEGSIAGVPPAIDLLLETDDVAREDKADSEMLAGSVESADPDDDPDPVTVTCVDELDAFREIVPDAVSTGTPVNSMGPDTEKIDVDESAIRASVHATWPLDKPHWLSMTSETSEVWITATSEMCVASSTRVTRS